MRLTILTVFLWWGQTLFASTALQLHSSWNERSSAKYNDIWGYTDPDGREYALLGVRNGTSIILLDDEDPPREVSFIPSATSLWKDIKTYKHYAYTVNESGGGLQIIDLSNLPDSAELVKNYTGFETSHNIFVDEANHRIYAEGNHAVPVRILSLEDPVNPRQIGSFGVECHDIYVRDNIAYISEGGHGTIGIFDTFNPQNVEVIKRFQIPNAGYVHNAWLSDDGNHLMTTEETTGKTVKYWDIFDLNNITQVGEYLGPNRLAHNAHIKGNYAYISHYGGGLRILDIRQPANLLEVAYYMEQSEPKRGFVDDWGTYPFLDSDKILISDIDSGLYVVEFDHD